jgi:hypothetical protein
MDKHCCFLFFISDSIQVLYALEMVLMIILFTNAAQLKTLAYELVMVLDLCSLKPFQWYVDKVLEVSLLASCLLKLILF